MNWRETADRTLALTGVVVAICAAVITFYQVHLMREQARIAVWPHIEQTPIYYDRNPYPPFAGDPLFKYSVTNTGLGPAYVRYLDVTFGDRTLHGDSWDPVMRLLAVPSRWQNLSASGSLDVLQNPLPPGTVLLQGQTQLLFEIIKNGAAEAKQRSERLAITICYCSLYGDCWTSLSTTNLNAEVKNCPDAETSGFYAGGNAPAKPAASGSD